MSYFINIEGLVDLERQEKWEEVRKMLYEKWENDRFCSKKLIRLLGECWHILSLWDCCIDTESLSFHTFQNTLIECTEFGLQNFKNDSYFLCVAGYMISTLPYLFYNSDVGDSYTEWEQKGINMIHQASELNPNDKVAKVLNLGHTSICFEKHIEAKRLLQSELQNLFSGETELEKYFKDILIVK